MDFKPDIPELSVRLAYCGPALSGKTTNLRALARLLGPKTCGRMMTLDTRDDRTLFFDLLPAALRLENRLRVRMKVFTVPGQTIHGATRSLLLKDVDGIVFVADSQLEETETNRAAFADLEERLGELGRNDPKVPLVFQFNKRDLADIRPDEELDALASQGQEPVYKATATLGTGVRETFFGLLNLVVTAAAARHPLPSGSTLALTQFEKLGDGSRDAADLGGQP